MTDHDEMVAELREWAAYHEWLLLRRSAGFFNEVADEIERLRAELTAAMNEAGRMKEELDLAQAVVRFTAEKWADK